MTGSRKKLILFSYDYPPSDGGIARLCHEIAIGAQEFYAEVIIVTRRKKGWSKPYNQTDTITVFEAHNKRICCEIDCFNYLHSIKNKNDYDVLCGIWHPEATIAIISGFKQVYTLAHGTELLSGTSKFRKYFWLPVYAHYILERVLGVIANSHYTQGLVKKVNKNVNAIAFPLAVNHYFFKPDKTDKREDFISLCSVSRIHQFKGHDFVIQTIASLPEEYRNKLRYNIAGTGAYLPVLKQLVEEQNMQKLVIFKGFVDDEKLPDFYNRNDLFILCTRESSDSMAVEGFGLVFLEAQSCSIPAIGTRTGGIPDAIEDGNGGWLIAQDNKQELADLLMRLLDSPKQIQQMGQKARQRIENFCTWQQYCKNLFSLFNS